MNADELLRLYTQGERNFRRQDLRGRSFKGKDLSGTDFSGADIRSADFTDAILRKANFTNAKTGLSENAALLLLIGLLATAGLLGGCAELIGSSMSWLLNHVTRGHENVMVVAGWLMLAVLTSFTILAVHSGARFGFRVFVNAFFVAIVGAILIPLVDTMISRVTIVFAAVVSIAVISNFLIALITIAATVVTIATAFAFSIVSAIVAAGLFILVLLVSAKIAPSGTFSVIIVTTLLLLSTYMGWRSLKGEEKHAPIAQLALMIATHWGTSFRGADLTNADFTQAEFKNVDFSNANLTRVRWDEEVTVGITPNLPGTVRF
ncbi:MAG: pentapeptide repeat-containing protein [Cyanobacteria bacterium CRU_2_1]|nr:pentapeptide repeat-containing protein [Cyanobacteria bacterium RU_5_0]NJR59519.1 pentapeptide repeat-containing protein [Cyanobacteria bacterium CRU_2_1]